MMISIAARDMLNLVVGWLVSSDEASTSSANDYHAWNSVLWLGVASGHDASIGTPLVLLTRNYGNTHRVGSRNVEVPSFSLSMASTVTSSHRLGEITDPLIQPVEACNLHDETSLTRTVKG